MAWAQQYANSFSTTQETQEVLKNHDNELKNIYNLLSQLMAGGGHAHTGAGSDGASVNTAGIVDGAITTAKLNAAMQISLGHIPDGLITPAKISVGLPPKGSAIPFTGTFGGTGSKYPMEDGAARTDWHICDGTDDTIDFRDKFILAAGPIYPAGTTGGEATVTLTIEKMPAHTHTENGGDGGTGDITAPIVSYNSQGVITAGVSTASTGGGEAHNNMPPFYSLAYIQRIS